LGYRVVKKNNDDMLSRFHLMPERYGQTDRFAISISRVSMLTSMLTRDKNRLDAHWKHRDFLFHYRATYT